MYKVKYYDVELQIVKGETFNTEQEANDFAFECINLCHYDKALVYDCNGCEVARYIADDFYC